MASIAFDLRKGIDLRHMNTANLTYTPQITDPAVTKQLFHNWDAYHDVAQLLPANSVVLTEYPISFVIATGIPAAFAPTSDLIFFPSHRYIPDPAFYDAFWRLDPAAWRALGATMILYSRMTYDALPPSVRRLVEVDGWFVKRYEGDEFLLLEPTKALYRYGGKPPNTLSALREALAPTDTLFLSPDLPYSIMDRRSFTSLKAIQSPGWEPTQPHMLG